MSTKTKALEESLKAGEVLILDGATGTEAQARGADVRQGYAAAPMDETLEGQRSVGKSFLNLSDPAEMRRAHEEALRLMGPWSAPLNVDAPEIIRGVHEDYLRAGADIIMSNNFFTTPSKLARVGAENEWERYARAGVELAIAARDAVKPEAFVVGGIAPGDGDLRSEFRDVSLLVADAGVDAILAEYLGAIDECVAAIEGASEAGLPVIIAPRHITEHGTMQYGETFEDLVAAIGDLPVCAILLMCSDPASTTAGLKELRKVYDGPIGAYANEAHDADEFARHAQDWVDAGAQIVGGCCGTTPKDIAAVSGLSTVS